MIVGLIKPDVGKVYLNNQNITKTPMYKRAKMGIGYLPQEVSVFRKLSVEDNIFSILEMTSLSKKQQKIRLEELIEEFGLGHVRKTLGIKLSGGEKRRVHFARTLIQVWNDNLQNDPSFMFLDEPTSNLDLYHELKLLKILKNESKKGKGILLIIHNLNLAFKFSDKIGIFKNGKLLSFGEPKEVFTNEILFDVFKIPIKVNSKNRTLNIY